MGKTATQWVSSLKNRYATEQNYLVSVTRFLEIIYSRCINMQDDLFRLDFIKVKKLVAVFRLLPNRPRSVESSDDQVLHQTLDNGITSTISGFYQNIFSKKIKSIEMVLFTLVEYDLSDKNIFRLENGETLSAEQCLRIIEIHYQIHQYEIQINAGNYFFKVKIDASKKQQIMCALFPGNVVIDTLAVKRAFESKKTVIPVETHRQLLKVNVNDEVEIESFNQWIAILLKKHSKDNNKISYIERNKIILQLFFYTYTNLHDFLNKLDLSQIEIMLDYLRVPLMTETVSEQQQNFDIIAHLENKTQEYYRKQISSKVTPTEALLSVLGKCNIPATMMPIQERVYSVKTCCQILEAGYLLNVLDDNDITKDEKLLQKSFLEYLTHPDRLKALYKINKKNLTAMFTIIENNPQKNEPDLLTLISYINNKKIQKIMLAGLGIHNVEKKDLNRIFEIYLQYQFVIDAHAARLKAKQRRLARMQVSDEEISLPLLAEQIDKAYKRAQSLMNTAFSSITFFDSENEERAKTTTHAILFRAMLVFSSDDMGYFFGFDLEKFDLFRQNILTVEKLRGQEFFNEEIYYLPVLLIEHYFKDGYKISNDFLTKSKFYTAKSEQAFSESVLGNLAISILMIQQDPLLKNKQYQDTKRLWCEEIVGYVNDNDEDSKKLKIFAQLAKAIKIINADKFLSGDEKIILYPLLINKMKDGVLDLDNIDDISALCDYVNQFGGTDIGKQIAIHMMTAQNVGVINRIGVSKYKKAEERIQSILDNRLKNPSFKRAFNQFKNSVVMIYASYSNQDGILAFLEIFLAKYFENMNNEFDGFYLILKESNEEVIKVLNEFRRNKVDVRHSDLGFLLQAGMYFQGIYTDFSFGNDIAKLDKFRTYLKDVFTYFPVVDSFFLMKDDDVNNEIDIIKNFLVKCQGSEIQQSIFSFGGSTGIARILDVLFTKLNIEKLLGVGPYAISSIKEPNKYEHILKLLDCHTQYDLIYSEDCKSHTENFHNKIFFANDFYHSVAKKWPYLSDQKQKIFTFAFKYPEIAHLCKNAPELESLLTIQLDKSCSKDLLQIQLYLMREIDQMHSLQSLLGDLTDAINLNQEEPQKSSTWLTSMTMARSADKDIVNTMQPLLDDSQSATPSLDPTDLFAQIHFHAEALAMVSKSTLMRDGKSQLIKNIAQNLQNLINNQEAIKLEKDDWCSVNQICARLKLACSQLLSFNSDRNFADFMNYSNDSLYQNAIENKEWEKALNFGLMRITHIFNTQGVNIHAQVKNEHQQPTPESDLLAAIYPNQPLSSSQEGPYKHHKRFYDVFVTSTPFTDYLAQKANSPANDMLKIKSDTTHSANAVSFREKDIYAINYKRFFCQITDKIKGDSIIVHRVDSTGYRVFLFEQEGDSKFINYARIAYFYSNLFNDVLSDDKVAIEEKLDEQIKNLEKSDLIYKTLEKNDNDAFADSTLLSQTAQFLETKDHRLYNVDNYSGKRLHRAILENWINLQNTKTFLLDDKMLGFYAHIFACEIPQKDNLPQVLYQFSLCPVQSMIQKQMFFILQAFLLGDKSEKACLQWMESIEEFNLDIANKPLFEACKNQLKNLSGDDVLAQEIEKLLNNVEFDVLVDSAKLGAYLTGTGSSKDKIIHTLTEFFKQYPLMELVKKSGTEPLALLLALKETLDCIKKEKLSTKQVLDIFAIILQYPDLMGSLPAINVKKMIQAEKIFQQEFSELISEIIENDKEHILGTKKYILEKICLNENYKKSLLQELGLDKKFSKKPKGIRSKNLRDKLLSIHFQYKEGLSAFFAGMSTRKIPYAYYEKVLTVAQATERYCSVFQFNQQHQRDSVFLMLLHSINFYDDKNDLVRIILSMTDPHQLAAVTTSADIFRYFINTHIEFDTKWGSIAGVSALRRFSIKEQITLQNQLVDMEMFYHPTGGTVIPAFFNKADTDSNILAKINKYKNLHALTEFVRQHKLYVEPLKAIYREIFSQPSRDAHSVLTIFNTINNTYFLTESEKIVIHQAFLKAYQSMDNGDENALKKIAGNNDIYLLMVLLNQQELIEKYSNTSLRQHAQERGVSLSRNEKLPNLQKNLFTSAEPDDNNARKRILAFYKDDISIYLIYNILLEYAPYAGNYVRAQNTTKESFDHIINVCGAVKAYAVANDISAGKTKLLFSLAINDDKYLLSNPSEQDILDKVNQNAFSNQHGLNDKISGKIHEFCKDLMISIDVVIKDEKLKSLADIYCDDDLKPVLMKHIKSNVVTSADGTPLTLAPYFQAVQAFSAMKTLTALDGNDRKQYYELLLCSIEFNEHILSKDDIIKVYSKLHTEVKNFLGEQFESVANLVKYYLTNIYLYNPGGMMTPPIGFGIYLSIKKQAVMPTDRPMIMALMKVYGSDLDLKTKNKIYAAIIKEENNNKFTLKDDVLTICEITGFLTEYKQIGYDKDVEIISTGLDKKDVAIKFPKYDLLLKAYMQDDDYLFLGDESDKNHRLLKMLYAYYKYKTTVSILLDHTKKDRIHAMTIGLFDKIINADLNVSQLFAELFKDNTFKIPKELKESLFKMEVALPGILQILMIKFATSNSNESNVENLAWLQMLVDTLDGIIDVGSAEVLLNVQTHYDNIKNVLIAQTQDETFFKKMQNDLCLNDVKKSASLDKMLPELMGCYQQYPVAISQFISNNKKYFLKYPLYFYQLIIESSQKITKGRLSFEGSIKIDDALLLMLFNYPMFLQTFDKDNCLENIEYAQQKIADGIAAPDIQPYILFCAQFIQKEAKIDQFIRDVGSKKENKFKQALMNLAEYLRIILATRALKENKIELCQNLINAFSNYDKFEKFNPELAHIMQLAQKKYTVTFAVKKNTGYFTDKTAVLKFFLKKIADLKRVSGYQGLTFNQGIFYDKAQENGDTLSVPAYGFNLKDDYKNPSLQGAPTVVHKKTIITAGNCYLTDALMPKYEDFEKGANAQSLNIEVQDGPNETVLVTASGPVEVLNQVIATYAVFDDFVKKFLKKDPGVNYLHLGQFEMQPIRRFSADQKTFYDVARWSERQLSAYHYNVIVSGLSNFSMTYGSRAKDEILKFNAASDLFRDGLALFLLNNPTKIEDKLEANQFSREIQLLSQDNVAPVLSAILDNLLAFDSIKQLKKGLFTAPNMQLIADIFNVRYTLGRDNLATLLCAYQKHYAHNDFSDALYEALTKLMCGKIGAAQFVETLEDMQHLHSICPAEKKALLENMRKIYTRLLHYSDKKHCEKYCGILGMASEKDDTVQKIIARAQASGNVRPFLAILKDLYYLRITPNEFKNLYHDADNIAPPDDPLQGFKFNIDEEWDKLNTLLLFFGLDEISDVKNLSTFHKKLNDLMSPGTRFCDAVNVQFSIKDKLDLVEIEDECDIITNNTLMTEYISTHTEPSNIRTQMINWLYLSDLRECINECEDLNTLVNELVKIRTAWASVQQSTLEDDEDVDSNEQTNLLDYTL